MNRSLKKPLISIVEVEMNKITSADSLQFDFSKIRTATGNFSSANKLGQGGFGVVYKVTFLTGFS